MIINLFFPVRNSRLENDSIASSIDIITQPQRIKQKTYSSTSAWIRGISVPTQSCDKRIATCATWTWARNILTGYENRSGGQTRELKETSGGIISARFWQVANPKQPNPTQRFTSVPRQSCGKWIVTWTMYRRVHRRRPRERNHSGGQTRKRKCKNSIIEKGTYNVKYKT